MGLGEAGIEVGGGRERVCGQRLLHFLTASPAW
jgi:hypothetical protein